MRSFERSISIPREHEGDCLLTHLAQHVESVLGPEDIPTRFAVVESSPRGYSCELAVLLPGQRSVVSSSNSIFEFRERSVCGSAGFNVALVVPTGIGAEVGGHAGDASPVAQVLSSVCDKVITHPNVVNASDLNEMPDCAMYVEGSVLTRVLMGTVGLVPRVANRVLVVIDAHRDPLFVNAAINSVNAARAAYGLRCATVVQLDPPVRLVARFAESGCAAGRVESMDHLVDVLCEYQRDFDAVALSSVIDVPNQYHTEYFAKAGEMVNPWGGVEAMLTHAISQIFNVPSAHSPMFESQRIANTDPGVVDPRMAAEAISLSFLQCILKGLHRSPAITSDRGAMRGSGVLTADDVSCLVIPDGCLGLPTVAAIKQGIPVIAVRENRNKMKNDLSRLPWRADQLYVVDNYWEAVGVLASLKAGISAASVRRPLKPVRIEIRNKAHEASLPESEAVASDDAAPDIAQLKSP